MDPFVRIGFALALGGLLLAGCGSGELSTDCPSCDGAADDTSPLDGAGDVGPSDLGAADAPAELGADGPGSPDGVDLPDRADASSDAAPDAPTPDTETDTAPQPDATPEPDGAADDPTPDPVEEVDPGPTVPADCQPTGERDCSPGPGEMYCLDRAPMFTNRVNAAIDGIIAENPEYFDFETPAAACCPFVIEHDLYVQGVAARVTASGLCAIQDPNAGDEMGVKLNNACAESYDILTAAGQVRRPPGAHTATCWPGWF